MSEEEKSAATTGPANPKPRPAGEPDGVTKLRDMVESALADMGDGAYGVDENGSYVLALESARVFVVPAWLEDATTVARVFAVTNLGVPVTAELTSYLLQKNLEFVFGGFALDVDEGAVWFNHNLLGEHMTPAELEATVGAVASTADRFDDEIKSRFGGRLYIESPEENLPAPTMPGYL